MAQTKTRTRRKPAARKTPATPTPRSTTRKAGIAAFAALGTIAAGAFAVLRFGLADRIAARRNVGGEHEAPDLAADAPVPGTDRAPDAFRPDPTAPVPASERASLAPAPTLPKTAEEIANQGIPSNGLTVARPS